MQQIMTREQLWEQFGRLDLSQQKKVAAFIESILTPEMRNTGRDKRSLLTLSVWNEEDIAQIQDAQDRINAWRVPVS